jgi:N-methylhydantoinase A/oxoprolinase/acetone carboxylase beta subunit
VPISLLAAQYPEVTASLAAELAEPEISSLAGKFIMRPAGARQAVQPGELSARESDMLRVLDLRPRSLQKVAASAGAQRAVNSLRRKGLVQLGGFTPSDAAHVLGLQANWSVEAALAGAQLTARVKDMRVASAERAKTFAQEVWSDVVRLSGRGILDAALGLGEARGAGETLLDAVCRGAPYMGLARVAMSPAVPIVAVGAAAKIYYEEVGRRLEAEVVFPPHCEVANAIGAAAGVIARSVTVQVSGDGGGVFRVHAPRGTALFSSGSSALEHARAAASEAARTEAIAMGAKDPEVRIEAVTHLLPEAMSENDLVAATITAEAIGRPEL